LAADMSKASKKKRVAGDSDEWKVDSEGLLRRRGKAYVPRLYRKTFNTGLIWLSASNRGP
jgi:hypothetical protein